MPVRIGFAFALLMLPVALAAQEGGIKRVAFIVTDQTGAGISNALIRVEGDAAMKPRAWITDRNGGATAEIVPGDRQFLISARGFATLKSTIDWESASIGPIHAALAIGPVFGPVVVVVGDRYIPTETQSLTDNLALIPTQQLPLPARRIHRKARRS